MMMMVLPCCMMNCDEVFQKMHHAWILNDQYWRVYAGLNELMSEKYIRVVVYEANGYIILYISRFC